EGDRILIAAAEICRQCFRKSDVISRIGGDEFAITAIDANLDSKEIIMKRFQDRLSEYNRTQNKDHQLSISIGATFYGPDEPMTFDELLARADRIMYESKSGKRIHELPAASKEASSIASKKIKPGYFAKTDVVKLLIIGADQKENNLIAKTLDQTTPPTIAVEFASKLEPGMKRLLDGGFSVLLLNIGQSGNLGIGIIKTICNTVPDIPIIIIADEKTDNELMINLIREGAQDCLIKQKIEKGRFKRSVLYAIERKHAELELKNNLHNFVHVLESTIETMASIVETRDPYTAGHQRRVSMLAESIAQAMNLSEEQTKSLRLAALIHDVGKIKIPENILSKPNKLDRHEMELIKNHPVSGFEILKAIKFPWLISQIVYQHHERINGSGYPNGIGDKDLLIESKILAVADVVEAMSSDRPYRKAPGIDKALQEIKEKSGELYDPAVVEACIKIFQSHSPPVLK
ncbi:hypothetical protein A2Y85_02750, partial [candidate division WOR-3 bacterium RBG_13_43_14]